jgi:hypothetical protein
MFTSAAADMLAHQNAVAMTHHSGEATILFQGHLGSTVREVSIAIRLFVFDQLADEAPPLVQHEARLADQDRNFP